jgi:hypothetical protein
MPRTRLSWTLVSEMGLGRGSRMSRMHVFLLGVGHQISLPDEDQVKDQSIQLLRMHVFLLSVGCQISLLDEDQVED